MALAKVKTEMKGDTSRWGRRAEYKTASKKRRRVVDRVLSEVRRDHEELLRLLAQ